jgi:hypothetical protein
MFGISGRNHFATGTSEKGKEKLEEGTKPRPCKNRNGRGSDHNWEPAPVKLNTDAAFCPTSRAANAGSIVRDVKRRVLLTAWRVLRGCASPEQAEACLEGLRLSTEWIRQATWVASDFSTLVNDIRHPTNSRSSLAGVLSEISAERESSQTDTLTGLRTKFLMHWHVEHLDPRNVSLCVKMSSIL